MMMIPMPILRGLVILMERESLRVCYWRVAWVVVVVVVVVA